MGRLRRSATETSFRQPINRISRPLSRVRTMFLNEAPATIPEEEPSITDSPFTPQRRRSLTWQGYYMSKKAKAQQLLETPDDPGSARKRLARSSMSAPAAASDGARQQDDVTSSPTTATVKSRKISLSCLVTSVLNFERGRRRASRAREEELLQSAEVGDLLRVKRICDNDVSNINISCTDPLGRTPLHLAVANEQKEVVQFLLGHVDMKAVYQALMLAINLGHDEIAEMIIEHPMYEEISSDIRQQGQTNTCFFLNNFGDDNQFTEEITPLILAAQQNRFEIVMALLMKGEVIGKPHKYNCFCDPCLRSARRDELKFAKARLNAYKGLASEAYISLSSEDPILTSFELRKELLNVCTDEKYYTAEYTSLAEQLSEYVVRLLDKVHGNEELNAILNADGQKDDDNTLPRLSLAIEYKEKKFVAHPSCQKKLTSMWYADFTTMLKSRSRLFSIGFVALITCFYPVLSLLYIFYPDSKFVKLLRTPVAKFVAQAVFNVMFLWLQFVKLLRTPVVKFVAQAVSFVLFLGLILTHSYLEQTKICNTQFKDDDDVRRNLEHFKQNVSAAYPMLGRMCIRNHSPSFLEVLILLWITGLVWQECKQVYKNGCRNHFLDVYNHMDFFMLKFYISSMALRQMQHIIVSNAYDFFRWRESWYKLLDQSDEALYKLYFLNADRFYWDAWDPYHVSEALFAVGNILNFTRLFYLLAISEHLGPMLISLERMSKDVMKFFVAFIPIFITFMVGLYNMYWYYNPAVRGQVELVDHNITTRAEEGFGSLEFTFRTVYWSLFGLKDSKLVELQDKTKPGVTDTYLDKLFGTDGYEVRFTESVGYIVFAVYNWIAVIVLLNMLIAMMTRSFEKINIHQDIEWKFARSKLYMEYIERGSTLPVPFNLVPSVKSIGRCFKDCFSQCDFSKICKRKRRGIKKDNIRITLSSAYDNEKPNGDCESNIDSTCETTHLNSTPSPNSHTTTTRKSSTTSRQSATNQSRSPSSSPMLKPRGSFAWGGRGNKDDYTTVVKRVVRRYIFEHLQATVGGEGSSEQQNAEAIRQEFHGLHVEINTIKPKVQTEFDRVRADMCEMRIEMRSVHKSLEEMQYQMASIFKLCKETSHRNQRIQKQPHFCDIYEKETDENSSGDVSDTDPGFGGTSVTNRNVDPTSPCVNVTASFPSTSFNTQAPLNSTPLAVQSIPSSFHSENKQLQMNSTNENRSTSNETGSQHRKHFAHRQDTPVANISAHSVLGIPTLSNESPGNPTGNSTGRLPSYDSVMRERRKSAGHIPSSGATAPSGISFLNTTTNTLTDGPL